MLRLVFDKLRKDLLDMSRYPTLNHFNVDLSTTLHVTGLMKDLLKLADDLKDDVDLLEVTHSNNKTSTTHLGTKKLSQRSFQTKCSQN